MQRCINVYYQYNVLLLLCMHWAPTREVFKMRMTNSNALFWLDSTVSGACSHSSRVSSFRLRQPETVSSSLRTWRIW